MTASASVAAPRPEKCPAAERLDLKENGNANAARLIGEFGPDLVYTTGKGWGVWDGCRFSFRSGGLRVMELGAKLEKLVEAEAQAWWLAEIDDIAAAKRVQEEIKKQKPEFADLDGAREAIRRENFARLMKHSVKCGNAAKVKSALEMAEHQVRVEIEALDANPWLFTCPNGSVDLAAARDADFTDAEPTEILAMRRRWLVPTNRAGFPTRCAGADYDPAATCPEWEAFTALIFPDPDVRAAFHRAMGMLLFGRNDAQVAFLFRGPGGNGKSTATQAIAMVLGENDGYVASCKIEMFIVTPQVSAGQATPEEVDIPGSRVMIASEPAATDELSAKKIKAMTGGDRRPARGLGKEQFYYRPQAVPILSFNRTPRIKDEDEGTRRRLIFFPFEVNLRELPADRRRSPSQIEASLRAERSGILNWMLDGWREHCRIGLSPTQSMQDLKAAVMERADPVGEFIADNCDLDAFGKVKVADAYTAYVEWCNRTGAVEYRKSGFTGLVQEKGYTKKKTDGGNWFYTGLRWRDSAGVRDLLAACNIVVDFSENCGPADNEPPPF